MRPDPRDNPNSRVPWDAIDLARAEAAVAVAALLDLTGPVGLNFVQRDAVAYVNTRLAMIGGRPIVVEDCDCDEEDEFELMEPIGLTARQWALLQALTAPRTSAELAAVLGWPTFAVGGVAASLARRGFVERVAGRLWSRVA